MKASAILKGFLVLLAINAIIAVALVATVIHIDENQVIQSRSGCHQRSLRLVGDVNQLRSDIVALNAEAAANTLSGAGAVTGTAALHQARRAAAEAENQAVTAKKSEIKIADTQISVKNAGGLTAPADIAIIVHNGYLCSRAYPRHSIWEEIFG